MKKSIFALLLGVLLFLNALVYSQSWDLTPENIDRAFNEAFPRNEQDTLRPAFHLTPLAGCMGDPNGGIYKDGWYHIFYGLQPFAHHPGGWYWAHARSKDLLCWEPMKTGLTPAAQYGLSNVGSGSTIINKKGKALAFYSSSQEDGLMKFWRAEFTDPDLVDWKYELPNPILTLDSPGLPEFDNFWRDPFVFEVDGRTFLIACADLFEADYVPVPIFEAKNTALTKWDYKGLFFQYPKYKYRNFEVPEFRPLGEKWIFMASADAPVDRCIYFTGNFDLENLKFIPDSEGIIDYSGHYYAQETIQDDKGDLYLMAWIPGWDRDWLPTYMNEPLKNSSLLWNGCFALPRKLSVAKDKSLIQKPVESLKKLRDTHVSMKAKRLPVTDAMTAYDVLHEIRGNQLEVNLRLDLNAASMCGINVLCNEKGKGGLFINWSGNMVNVDGVTIPLTEWKPGDPIQLHIFVDKQLVEVFINGGKYCASRKVRAGHIKGDRVALTTLGGTAKLISMQSWKLKCFE